MTAALRSQKLSPKRAGLGAIVMDDRGGVALRSNTTVPEPALVGPTFVSMEELRDGDDDVPTVQRMLVDRKVRRGPLT